MAYDRPVAPGVLERIELFCNSARFLYGEDTLAELASARDWLRRHAWDAAADALDDRGRRDLVRVREAIRAHIEGGAHGDAPRDARATLDAFSQATLLAPRWDTDGEARIPVAAETPVDAVIGTLLAALAAEELAGLRGRLKVCRLPECRWLFYDRSPANNSVWCSMSICGARHKMRSYRARRAG